MSWTQGDASKKLVLINQSLVQFNVMCYNTQAPDCNITGCGNRTFSSTTVLTILHTVKGEKLSPYSLINDSGDKWIFKTFGNELC